MVEINAISVLFYCISANYLCFRNPDKGGKGVCRDAGRNKMKDLSTFTTDELLAEIAKRGLRGIVYGPRKRDAMIILKYGKVIKTGEEK